MRKNRWAFTLVEVVALISLVGFLSAAALVRAPQGGGLRAHRAAMQDVARAIRTMRGRAIAQHRPTQLHIDAAQRCFRFATAQDDQRLYEIADQTLWLPEGLQVSEAPALLTALPSGEVSPSSILVSTPAHHRLFRLRTDARGTVSLDEDPVL